LYGITYYGGSHGRGTAYEITLSGAFTTIYNFCSDSQSGTCLDGQYPYAGLVVGDSGELLVLGSDGNLYGATQVGGANGGGTIFKVTLSGQFTVLYNFCAATNCLDGSNPVTPLVQATNGDFYGTTPYGGANGSGTLFSLSLGLSPFVEIQPSTAKTGAVVKILGQDLNGATGVSFNGASAAFTVISNSLINATVPEAAGSGTVQVQTPGGTLSSNVPFRVRP